MKPIFKIRTTSYLTWPNILRNFTRPALISVAVLALIAGGLLTWHSAAAARAIGLARTFAALPVDVSQPTAGPGVQQVGSNAPKSAASSTKAGSVLFFGKYTSESSRPNVVNTLLTLTNTNPRDGVAVSLHYVHDCVIVNQKFINLAAHQTTTLLMSKEAPNTTGYVVAIAVDSHGLPTQFNWLIGSATLHDARGREASYNAVAVAKRTAGSVVSADGNVSANMRFDNIQYDRLPKLVALDNIQNQNPATVAAAATDVMVYSPLADLSGNSAQSLQISAVAYDHNGRPYPETINAGCGLNANINSVWTATPLNSYITPDNPGWGTFAATNNNKTVPVLGLSLTEGTSSAQHSARNMQALALLDTFTINLPLKVPTAPAADTFTTDLVDATGGATGASELKAGSILLYSRFASGIFGGSRISLTNTHPTQKARVRVFFNGMANTPATTETIVTLLPNQTTTLNAQAIAPDQHGWVMAMVIDVRALPINFNYLIGSAQVNEPGGQTCGFNALAIARNAAGTVPRNSDVQTSDILFDDTNYDRLPATVAFSAVPSQVDNTSLLGYARPGDSLLNPPSTRGAVLLSAYSDLFDSASMTMGPTEAKVSTLRPSTITPFITSTFLKGHRGWFQLTSSSPLFAWFSNLAGAPLVTTAEGDWTGGMNGGGNPQTLTTTDMLLKVPSTNPNNQPPVAGAATIGFNVEARRADGTIVRLDASFSSDPDPEDVMTYQWFDNDVLVSILPIADLKLGIGPHNIRLVVTDGSGVESAPDEQFVQVVDTTPPQLSGIPSAITRVTGSLAGVTINFPKPIAYDMVDGTVPVNSSKQPNSTFPIGTTTVVFSARDTAGNVATARMDVTVTKGTGTFPQKGGTVGDMAPKMDNINDQYIPAGQTRNIPLQATDPDGDPISFSLLSTTPSARLLDINQAAGTATLQITLQSTDRAFNTIRVVANDGRGQIFTTLPFRVSTSEVPNDDTGSGGMNHGGGGGGGTGGGGGDTGGGGGDTGGGGPPPNHPPVAVAAALPPTIKATSRDGAPVHLDGSASNDPDNEALTYAWTEGAKVIAQGALVDITLPVGPHSIVLTVTDPKGATNSTAPLSVTILPRDLTVINVTPVRVSQFYTLDMTINGTGFNSGTKISLSGTGITIVKYVSIEEDKIVVTLKTTQSTPLGNRDLFVTNPEGPTTVRLSRAFYIAP